jgi:hypothetical protein
MRHHADDERVAQLRASRAAFVHQVARVEQPVDEHQGRVQELAQHHRGEVPFAAPLTKALDASALTVRGGTPLRHIARRRSRARCALRNIDVGVETEQQCQAVPIDLGNECTGPAMRRRLGKRSDDVAVFDGKQWLRGELPGDSRSDPLQAGAVRRIFVSRHRPFRVVLAEQTAVTELDARLTHDRLHEVLRDINGCITRNESRSLGLGQSLLQAAKESRPDARLDRALAGEEPAQFVRELRRDSDVRVLQDPQRGMGETSGIGPRID